jgi:hypothetical protein
MHFGVGEKTWLNAYNFLVCPTPKSASAISEKLLPKNT